MEVTGEITFSILRWEEKSMLIRMDHPVEEGKVDDSGEERIAEEMF